MDLSYPAGSLGAKFHSIHPINHSFGKIRSQNFANNHESSIPIHFSEMRGNVLLGADHWESILQIGAL